MMKLKIIIYFLFIIIGIEANLSDISNFSFEITSLDESKEDFFTNIKENDYNNTKFYKVDDYNEIYEDYLYILEDDTIDDIVFYIKETDSFLAKRYNKLDENEEIIDMDDMDDKVQKRAKERNNKDEWIEYSFEDVEENVYPGYIPISPCLSQEYGKLGSVTFTYSFNQQTNIQKTFVSTFGIPLGMFSASIALTLEVAITKSSTTQGQIQCNINQGTIGQVLLKPIFIACVPKRRKMKWLSKLRKFTMSSKFKRYEKVFLLLENSFFQIDCATSDVVDLFCECELGVQDWDSPLGIGYEDIVYEKNASRLISQ